MAHTYSHLYDLPTTGLRFFTVYGPWGRPDMAPMIFARSILNNEPIKVFNHGKMQRDFTYIDDVVEGIICCCFKKASIDDDFNWGFFKIRLDDSQLKYKFLSYCINLRSKIFSYSTGDQVLIIKKDLFDDIKGYLDINLMEDIEITCRLKKICKPILFEGNAISSPRRWKKNGFFKTILQMRILRMLYHFGVCTNKLNKLYK